MALWVWFGALVVVSVLLFAYAGRSAGRWMAAILLVFGAAVFLVRLHHKGSYPFPRGADLEFASASLLVGFLLFRSAWRNRTETVSLVTRLLIATAPILLLGAFAATLHEMEEVVVLRTCDAQGAVQETRLWVVDYAGATWIVTGPSTEHVRRLTANPRVELVRHGATSCFVATRYEDRETIEAVLHQRSEKYFVHRLALAAGFWRPPGGDIEKIAVAIRLDPCPS
jgi:hypothetical protein